MSTSAEYPAWSAGWVSWVISAPVAAFTTAALWVCLWVSTPMMTSTVSANMFTAFLLAKGDVVPVRFGDRQDCDGTHQMQLVVKLLIRPVPRVGPAPSDRQRTCHKQDTPKRSVKKRATFTTTRRHSPAHAGLHHRYSQSGRTTGDVVFP